MSLCKLDPKGNDLLSFSQRRASGLGRCRALGFHPSQYSRMVPFQGLHLGREPSLFCIGSGALSGMRLLQGQSVELGSLNDRVPS